MLLDEPTAGLEHDEMNELAQTLRSLSSEWGYTIVLVSHHIGFVSGLADWVTVMDFGKDVAHGPTAEVLANSSVLEAFTGVPARSGIDAHHDDEEVTRA